MDDLETRKRKLRYRAGHRGTREADFLFGGFAERYVDGWGEAEMAWFEALLQEQDVDVMAWAIGGVEAPAWVEGGMMDAMRQLDFIEVGK